MSKDFAFVTNSKGSCLCKHFKVVTVGKQLQIIHVAVV